MVRYLIIHWGDWGETLLTTPLIRCLKGQVENAEIQILTSKEFALQAQKNTNISKVYQWEDNIKELIPILRNEYFDYIIDLQSDKKSKKLSSKLWILSLRPKREKWSEWLFINFRLHKNKLLNRSKFVQQSFELINLFDVKDDNLGLEYFLPHQEQINQILSERNITFNNYVVFAPKSKYFTRSIPVEKAVEICEKISLPIIFIGNKEDFSFGEEVITQISKPEKKIINLFGKTNTEQSAALISSSKEIITTQNSYLHLATALKKNIISIWGNTLPELEIKFYDIENHKKIFISDLKCRPCTMKGFRICPKKHFKCMQSCNFNKIFS